MLRVRCPEDEIENVPVSVLRRCPSVADLKELSSIEEFRLQAETGINLDDERHNS